MTSSPLASSSLKRSSHCVASTTSSSRRKPGSSSAKVAGSGKTDLVMRALLANVLSGFIEPGAAIGDRAENVMADHAFRETHLRGDGRGREAVDSMQQKGAPAFGGQLSDQMLHDFKLLLAGDLPI